MQTHTQTWRYTRPPAELLCSSCSVWRPRFCVPAPTPPSCPSRKPIRHQQEISLHTGETLYRLLQLLFFPRIIASVMANVSLHLSIQDRTSKHSLIESDLCYSMRKCTCSHTLLYFWGCATDCFKCFSHFRTDRDVESSPLMRAEQTH